MRWRNIAYLLSLRRLTMPLDTEWKSIMNVNKLFGTVLSLFLATTTPLYAKSDDKLINKPEMQAWFKEMEAKHGLQASELKIWFKNVTVQDKVLAAIQKPAEGTMPWYKYQKIFLSKERAEAGAKFWKENEATLKKAEAQYGVPASIIVAILGVETYYGRQAGRHPVLDTLATLAFEYPPRSKFFKQELEEFVLLAKEEKLDPTKIYGSYAGAMGTPQFIASSYRHYAVDFNQNGQRDLINSTEDSIGSVANYFKKHGWVANQPVIMPANVKGDQFKTAMVPLNNPKPIKSLTAYHKMGVATKTAFKQDYTAGLISLDVAEAKPEYFLGLQNFYVITRYNHSSLYAMAVYQLSQDIERARRDSHA